jgi:hypothetical protein
MDYLTRKELEGLKNDIESKNIAVEADKYAFEMKLLNGMGESMMRELRTPSKPSWITSVKIKFAKWKMLREEKNNRKKIMGDL